jgi:hypothetical protein
MKLRPYAGYIVFGIILWLFGTLAVVGILYVGLGAKMWHPLN